MSEQSRYNLAARTVELEVIAACRACGLGLFPYGPLRGGLLAGGVRGATVGRHSGGGMQELAERHRAQVEAYEGLCRRLGREPAVVALAWLLRRPGVTAPIVGPRTVGQLEGGLRALELRLADQALARLDEIWPGPGEAS